MAHAQICPICGGKGNKIREGTEHLTSPTKETCNGCGSKGWVEVQDAAPNIIPYPYINPYWYNPYTAPYF